MRASRMQMDNALCSRQPASDAQCCVWGSIKQEPYVAIGGDSIVMLQLCQHAITFS